MRLDDRQRPLATRAVRASIALLMAGTLAAGCAQKSPPAKSAPDAGPSSLAEALAAFEESEDELQAFLGGKAEGGAEFAQPGADAAPQPTAPAQQRESELSTAPRYRRNRCDQACDAFGSMRRSADRLCDMTGEEDQRCGDVRERVRSARATVHQACPTCAEAGS